MNLKNKIVSIIIPCYNDAKYIEQAVNSVLNQIYSNIEIIVVDDGSNSETKLVLKNIESKVSKLITQDNKGVCESRNIAINKASGDYILTLDSDDFFDPYFLEKAVSILDLNDEIGMVTCWAQVINEKGKNLYIQKPTGATANKALYYNNSIGCCLYRKKIWEDVGGYDLNMKNGFEDWEFNISITKIGWKVHVINEVLFYYRLKPKSRNSLAKNYQSEIRKYVFNKHKDLAIQNFESTIDFFLNEIECLKKDIYRVRNSTSYKIGHYIVVVFKKISSILSFKKR